MQRDTNKTPRCHVMKWSIRKQRQRHWDHRNMEWQKHRCLKKDILTVARVGEHWKSVLVPLSSEGITLVLDDGLWREPHTGWGCGLGWFYDCWESCKIHPAVAIGTNSSASMEMQGQSKKQTGKNRPFSPNTVFPAHATDGEDQRAAGGAVMMPGPIHTAEYRRVGDSSCN